jgi:hypothetical protein
VAEVEAEPGLPTTTGASTSTAPPRPPCEHEHGSRRKRPHLLGASFRRVLRRLLPWRGITVLRGRRGPALLRTMRRAPGCSLPPFAPRWRR